MTDRYYFEYPRVGECLIFDRTIGTTTSGQFTGGVRDEAKAVATCRDPEMAQKIVDFLNRRVTT